MGLRQLIQLATILAFAAVATHQLPTILKEVRLAQLYLLKDSQASKWGQAMLLPVSE